MELAAIGAVAIGVVALVAMRSAPGRLARNSLIVLLSPLLVAAGFMALSVLFVAAQPNAVGNAFFVVMLFGTILFVPWLAAWGIGLGIGLALRRRFPPPARPAPPVPVREAAPVQPARPIFAAPPQTILPPGPPAAVSQTAPDGRIRVDIEPVEWAASLFVNTPRAVEIASGRILCDLHGTDWEASTAFPGDGQLWLGLRRYRSPGHLFADFDLVTNRYRIALDTLDAPEEEGPIGDISARLEAWWPLATARATALAPPARPVAAPGRFAAWRTALAILVGALVVIAGLTYVSLKTGVAPPHGPVLARPIGVPPG